MNQQTLPWLLVGLALGYYLRGYADPVRQPLAAPLTPLQPGLYSRLRAR